MEKNFGDKDLGQILNEVADPNFKTQKRRVVGHGSAEMGKDAFLKLMMEQLKQQDPTNPLKSHEMAAQLAQFSSVEQLANMNTTLNAMNSKGSEEGRFEVLNLIGKVVSGDSGQIDRMQGDKEHNIEFNLPEAAESVTIKITDEKGILIKKYDLKDLKAGKNQLAWNGMHDDGKDARVGRYQADITATAKGKTLHADTKFTGSVEAVQFSAKGPVLVVGGKTLSLKDVKKIEGQKEKSMDFSRNLIKPDEKVSSGAVIEKPILANLDTAQMDQSLREKIEGTVKKPNLVKE